MSPVWEMLGENELAELMHVPAGDGGSSREEDLLAGLDAQAAGAIRVRRRLHEGDPDVAALVAEYLAERATQPVASPRRHRWWPFSRRAN